LQSLVCKQCQQSIVSSVVNPDRARSGFAARKLRCRKKELAAGRIFQHLPSLGALSMRHLQAGCLISSGYVSGGSDRLRERSSRGEACATSKRILRYGCYLLTFDLLRGFPCDGQLRREYAAFYRPDSPDTRTQRKPDHCGG
jgi:hypothetical protein